MAELEFKVKVEGLDKIRDNIKRYPKIAVPIYNQAIRRGLLFIEGHAISETPVITGILKGSYTAGRRFGNLRGSIGPTAFYALFVHEGHRQQVGRFVPAIGKRLVRPFVKGNPFFERGFDAGLPDFNKEMQRAGEEIANAIAKI